MSTDTITIEADKVTIAPAVGAKKEKSLKSLVDAIVNKTVQGLNEESISDNVKWLVSYGQFKEAIVELKPQLRKISWVADNSPAAYGSEAKYKTRRLATPYVILKVPILGGAIQGNAELFYRNEPLRSLDDKLYWANLLNVSPNAYGCLAWVCTQYLDVSKCKGSVTNILHELIGHLFGGGFNKSSEAHEGQSTFSKAKKDGLDSRVTDVNKWEEESIKDPRFILDIKWKTTSTTVRDLIDKDLKQYTQVDSLKDSSALTSALLKSK